MTHLIQDGLSDAEQTRVADIQHRLLKLQEVLNSTFPGREFLTDSIVLSLMMGEHLLVYGDPGTAKTLMLRSTLRSIIGASIFDVILTAQTTPSHLLGAQILEDLKRGEVNYNVTNSVLTSDFALFDEILDANSMTLRSLVSPLNERIWMHGQKTYHAKLRTAFAATNVDPNANKDSRIQAVIDRFLFQAFVTELQTEADQISMLAGSLSPRYTLPELLNVDDIIFLQDIIRGRNLIHDLDIIVAYNNLVNQFEKASGINITDRGRVKALQSLEASCLLRGSWVVEIQDIFHLDHIFCDSSDPAQLEHFQKLAVSTIKDHQTNIQNKVDAVEMALITQLNQQLPDIVPNMTADELIKAYRALEEIKHQASQIQTATLPDTQAKLDKLRKKIDTTEKRLHKAIRA
jgi:MoxR-like ATPase